MGKKSFKYKTQHMLINCKLSWDYLSPKENWSFPAYYDSSYEWKEIRECFVKKDVLQSLVKYLAADYRSITKSEWKAKEMQVVVHGSLVVFQPEQVRIQGKVVSRYRISAARVGLDSFFNYNASQDDRLFTFCDIYEAVLHGLRIGINAGLTGKDIVHGQKPREYAWQYTERQHGS